MSGRRTDFFSAVTPSRPGDRCGKARWGCIGRLVVVLCRNDMTANRTNRYIPDADGTLQLLTCDRCGQAHGLA